jgi:hypothetical protein
VLDDAVAIRRIRKLEAQDLRLFFRLLKPIPCGPIGCFGLHDRDGKIAAMAKQIIGAFLRTADGAVADKHDPAGREALLFTDLRVFPAGAVELWNHVRPTSVRFVDGHGWVDAFSLQSNGLYQTHVRLSFAMRSIDLIVTGLQMPRGKMLSVGGRRWCPERFLLALSGSVAMLD